LPAENDFVTNPNAKDLNVITGLDQLNRMIAKKLSDKIAPCTVKRKALIRVRELIFPCWVHIKEA